MLTSFKTKNANRTKNFNFLLTTSSLALLGCGGGGGSKKDQKVTSSEAKLPNKTTYGLTGDIVIDSMTQGSKWIFSESTYNYGLANSNSGAKFSDQPRWLNCTEILSIFWRLFISFTI